MNGSCGTCKLPLASLVRDEIRLGVYQVLLRCADCKHIVLYRSSGLPQPSDLEIHAQMTERLAA